MKSNNTNINYNNNNNSINCYGDNDYHFSNSKARENFLFKSSNRLNTNNNNNENNFKINQQSNYDKLNRLNDNYGTDNNNKNNSHDNGFGGGISGTLLVIIATSIFAIKLLYLFVDRNKNFIMTTVGAGNGDDILSYYYYQNYGMQFLTTIKTSTITFTDNYGYVLWPIIFGICISIFTWIMMYLDSQIPGKIPQTPFGLKQYGYRYHNERSCHLNYIISIAIGFVVFFLLCYSNVFQEMNQHQSTV